MRRAIEAKNILIFQSMGYRGKWKVTNENLVGFSIPCPVAPVIFIRKQSLQRQVFTLFHELAHILLHDEVMMDHNENFNFSLDEKKEREVNRFAGLCLVPDSILEDIEIPRNVIDYEHSFKKITQVTGASTEVVLRRLLDSNRITNELYKKYNEYKVL